jgi:hypothetical protein
VTSRATVHNFTLTNAVLTNSTPVIGWNPQEPCQKGMLMKFVALVNTSGTDGSLLGSIGVHGATV